MKKEENELEKCQTEACKQRRASKMAVYSALGIMLFQNALPLTSVYAQEHTEPATEAVTEGLEFEDELIPEKSVLAEPAAAELEDSEGEQGEREGTGEGSEGTAGDLEAEENLIKNRTAKQIDNEEAAEQRQSRATDAVFDYEVFPGGVMIKGLTTPPADGHLIVPAKIENKNVWEISHRSFKDSPITAVTFEENPNLTSIDLGNYMFEGSTVTSANLSGLTALKSLYVGMFNKSDLETVDLSGCTALTSIGSNVFNGTDVKTIDLSQNVNLINIGSNTIRDTPLTSVNLSKNTKLTSLGENTFQGTQLTSIDLSKNTQLTSIGSATFRNTPLTKIDLSGGAVLTSIGNSTFQECPDLYEVYAGTNFTQVCEAFKASRRTHINSDAVIVSNPAAAVDLTLDGSTYAAIQNQGIMIKDLYEDKASGYAVTLPAEVRAIQAGLPSGIGIIWKDGSQNFVDLTQTNATAFSGLYNGETGWTNVDVIKAADISLKEAAVTADGQAKPLDQNRIKYNKTGYENYALPIDKIQYKLGEGAYTDEAPKAAGTYQIQLTLKAANGSTKTVQLTDTYEIQAADRSLAVSGEGIVEDTDYTFDDNAKTLTINTNKAMTIKNTDIAKIADYQIVVPDGVTADLTLDGVNIELDKAREGAIHIFAGGTAAITLASGSENSLKNTGDTGRGILNVNAGDDSAASLVLKGEGSLALKAWSAYGGSGTIKNGTYQFTGNFGISANGHERLTIESGDITVTGSTAAVYAERKDTMNLAGGKIKAVSTDDSMYGIAAICNAMITGGTVDVESIRRGISNVQISGGEVNVTISEKSNENHYVLYKTNISGGTITLNNKGTSFDINGTNTVTGGSVRAVNGKVEDTVMPANHQFTQLVEYPIPEAGAQVTVDSGTPFSVPANHKNLDGTKIDDKLSFFLEKGEDHKIVVKDPATQVEKTYLLIWEWDSGSVTDGDWYLVTAPTIITAELPDATTGTDYEATLEATRGGTITWKLAPGSSLPAGLSLAASTGEISGTPTTAGDYSFSVIAENEVGSSAAKALALKIAVGVTKEDLQKLYDDAIAADRQAADYTPASWSAYQAALDDAKGVLDKTDATQDEVDTAKDNLEKAVAGLVTMMIPATDQAAINAALTVPLEAPYNGQTREAIIDESVLPEAYKGQITIAYKQGETLSTEKPKNAGEYKVIVQVQDRDSFDSAKTIKINQKALTIIDVKGKDRQVNNSLRVELSGGSLIGVVKNEEIGFELGTGIIADEAAKTTAGTYDVTTNIQLTGMGLGNYTLTQPTDVTVTLISKVDLWILYDEEDSKGRTAADYTTASWEAYEGAMEEAARVLNDEDATQKETDDAKKALEDAVTGLVYQTKADLDGLINDTENNYKEDDYTSDSWDNLQEVLEEVKEIANDPASTPDELQAAEDKLQDAIDDLVKKGDTTHLQELVDEAGKRQENQYTPETWANLAEAKKAAEDLIAKRDASDKTVKAAEDKLQNALNDLQKKADFSALQKLYDEETKAARAENQYTSASWKAYDDAMKAADQTLQDLNATQKEVNDAKKALEDAVSGFQKLGNKTDLNKLIAEMEALSEADFTKDSWNKLQTALKEAKAVAKDDQATDKAVAKAQEDLGKAKNQLVNIKGLQDLSNTNFEKNLYTKDSWKVYAAAKIDAQKVLAKKNATQKEVNDAETALQNAINGLEYKAKADLDQLIKETEALDQNDYTSGSWGNLQEILEEVKDITNDPTATPDELKDAKDKLQDAIDDLVKKGDTTHLQELVDEAEKRQEDQYTPETWANLAEAKKEAEDLITTGDASEQEVKEAEDKLQAALNNLQNRADFSALQKLYDEETKAARDENQYTSASWKAYDDAMKAAEQVLQDPNATQKQVDTAKKALEDAVSGLQKLGDKADLNKLIKEMEALKEADFTKDSWNKLQTALKEAKAVAKDDQSTDKAVAKAQEDLGKAKNQLVNIKGLQDLYEKEYKKDLYTDTSWTAYQKAHDAAKTILNNPKATQKQVDEAEKALNKAITNLETKKHAQLDQLVKEEVEKGRDEKDYTAESWNVYEKALTNARKVLADSSSTEKDMEDAAKTLQTAISGLKKATTSQGSGGSTSGGTSSGTTGGSTTKTYPSTSRTTTPGSSTTTKTATPSSTGKSISSSMPKTGAVTSGLPMGLGAGIIAAVSAIFKRRRDKK